MKSRVLVLGLMVGLLGTVFTGNGVAYQGVIARHGNQLIDDKGNVFRFRGVSIEDPEVIVLKRHQSLQSVLEEVVAKVPAVNAIRVPMHPYGAEGCAGIWANPDAYIDSYIVPLISIARSSGLRLILCYHAIKDWNSALLNSEVVPFWNKVLSHLGPDDTHVSFELFNEAINPADWSSWRDEFAQPLVNWCNSAAPSVLPLVGSPNWNQFYPPEAATGPVTGNFAHVCHTYPGHGTTAAAFEASFGAVADVTPLVCTEFGFEATSSDSWLVGGMDYFNALTSWLDSRHLGSVAWIYSSTWQPRMLTPNGASLSAFGTATRDYYQRLRDASNLVIHEGGWNITKPATIPPGGAVEVFACNVTNIWEVICAYAGSSSAQDRILCPGYLRVTFEPDNGGAVVQEQVTLPYGPLNDYSGPTSEGTIRIAPGVPASGRIRVFLGHSNWRTQVHTCTITVNPEAPAAWDTGYQSLGGGWRRLSWFGDYVPMGTDGWIWHDKHGFLFVPARGTQQSCWLYSQDMGWLWTGSTTYPFLYRASPATWLWYNGSRNPRWFYNMTLGRWERG